MTSSSTTPAASVSKPAIGALPIDRAADVSQMLRALAQAVEPQRRVVHCGDLVYRAGERFSSLYILNSGFTKVVKPAADGREQLVSLNFRGDWMGFDGIARGAYDCDGVAMDTGEVWGVRYDALMAACVINPALMTGLHEAMSREISRERESLMSICTLPADARVADFLRGWAESAGQRGLRTDEITIRLSRAEIGNYLGLTLESVSRAFSKLVKTEVIGFSGAGRRDVRIPDLQALANFVQRAVSPQVACTV